MAAIRSLESISKKWAERAASAGQQFADGVRQPKRDWQKAAAAAEGNWEAGVASAARAKSFGKGVNRAGTAKWQSKAIAKGTVRYGPGVQEAEPDFRGGFDRFRQVIESTQLPPRFAKGDPRNLERVKAMSVALRKAKVGG